LSLKEKVDFVKEELSSEEKFFEKAVVTERFVKKYKKSLIVLFVAVIVLAVANVAYTIKEQHRIEAANAQLALLMKNPTDLKAQNSLKSLSPKLFSLWSFSHALTTNDTKRLNELKSKKLPVISDIAAYEVALSDRKPQELTEYSLRQNAIYKELANIASAVVYMNENRLEKAKEQLATISKDSTLGSVAAILNHYGAK